MNDGLSGLVVGDIEPVRGHALFHAADDAGPLRSGVLGGARRTVACGAVLAEGLFPRRFAVRLRCARKTAVVSHHSVSAHAAEHGLRDDVYPDTGKGKYRGRQGDKPLPPGLPVRVVTHSLASFTLPLEGGIGSE